MDEFLFKENIAHFKRKLATETDSAKRAVLQTLIAEEEAKLATHLAELAEARRVSC